MVPKSGGWQVTQPRKKDTVGWGAHNVTPRQTPSHCAVTVWEDSLTLSHRTLSHMNRSGSRANRAGAQVSRLLGRPSVFFFDSSLEPKGSNQDLKHQSYPERLKPHHPHRQERSPCSVQRCLKTMPGSVWRRLLVRGPSSTRLLGLELWSREQERWNSAVLCPRPAPLTPNFGVLWTAPSPSTTFYPQG